MPESASRFRFRSRGVPDGLKVSHPIFEQKIEDILSLGDHDAIWSMNYIYTEEVMKLLHFESVGERFFYMIDICNVLSSNDIVVHIYDNKQLSPGIAPDEQGIVRLGHFEADLVNLLGYL